MPRFTNFAAQQINICRRARKNFVRVIAINAAFEPALCTNRFDRIHWYESSVDN